jgi:hypothetical protein
VAGTKEFMYISENTPSEPAKNGKKWKNEKEEVFFQ